MENAKKKMELYRVILGQLLIEARKEKGFSQQAVLCDSCGFDYVQIIKKLQKSVSKMED